MLLNYILLLFAVSSVATADVLLKKTAAIHSLMDSYGSSPFLWAVFLYALQVAIFLMIFRHGVRLSFVSVLQTVAYSLITLAAATLYFHEQVSARQWLGISLAVSGVLLMSG